MNTGFTVIELLVSLTITTIIMCTVLTSVSGSTALNRKINKNQENLEAIFLTVDTMKSDLSKCGMRLKDQRDAYCSSLFTPLKSGFSIKFGSACLFNTVEAEKGAFIIPVEKNTIRAGKSTLFIKNNLSGECFTAEAKSINSRSVRLNSPLRSPIPAWCSIILVKTIEYKYCKSSETVKRKINRGHFQPLLSNVTDFYINYYPDTLSVLYRLEINKKEQVRGYIFLNNMVRM